MDQLVIQKEIGQLKNILLILKENIKVWYLKRMPNFYMEVYMKKYLYSQKLRIISIITLSIVTNLFSIFIVINIQKIVDSMIVSDSETFNSSIWFLVSSFIMNFILSYLLVLSNSKLKKDIHKALKKDIIKSFFRMEHKDFIKTLSSQKMNVFETDLNILDNHYFENMLSLLKNSLLILFGTIYLLTLNVKMALLMIFCSILILFLPFVIGKNLDELSLMYSKNKDRFLSKIKEIFESMDLIHSYGIESKIFHQFDISLEELERSLYLFNRNLGLYSQVIGLGNYIIMAVSFSMGGYFVINKELSVGELIAIAQMINIIIGPIGETTTGIMEIKGAEKIRNKIVDLLNYSKEDGFYIDEKDFDSIELNDLCYQQENSDFSLYNLNLKIEKNKKYVILGRSGSGKSTLLKILANILTKTSGELFLNGNEYSMHENISNIISYVSQDIFIFNDSLINNVTLYKQYDKEDIEDAIEFSMLEDLQNRNLTPDLSLSEILSGGERKKLALARAMLSDTDVILLDELNSSLDPNSSKILEDRIFDLKDKTIVMVTHKINYSNLLKADEIICIDNGKIIEKGNLNRLIENKGYFYRNFGELYGKDFRNQKLKKVI